MRNIRVLLVLVTLLPQPASAQSITSDTLEIGEVVVTETKVEVVRKNVPMTVSVVGRETLEQSSESALLPVLSEQVPGLFVTERGVTGFGVSTGAAGQINIRGLGGNPTTQVLILIDGHPQFMGMMGHHLPDAYVTADAERVEVIRGPASILYGSNAFGGAINIITRKQKKDGLTATARIQYGSFNTQKYLAAAGFRKNRFTIFTSVNHDRTEGHRDSSDFHITNGYIKSTYSFNQFMQVTADFNMAKYETGDPGPESGIPGERIDILRGKTALSLENKYEHLEGALKLYYNFGDHDITDGWHSNDEMFGLMLYQGLKLFAGNILTAGYDFMQYGGKGSPVTTVIRDKEGNVIMPPQFVLSDASNKWMGMNDHAFYAFVQQNLFSSLILNGGLRYEINATYGNEWIPQAGLVWNITAGTAIKSSLSKGYRPPSIRELYLFPPANEKLLPERMTSFEAGWSQHWIRGKMKTELTGFAMKGQNLIVMVPSAPPPPPLYKNTGNFSNRGIECALQYDPISILRLQTNYTLIDMKTPLPGTPEHNLFLSGTCSYKKFTFMIKLQNIFNLYNDTGEGTVEVIEVAYSILGSRIGYRANRFLDVYLYGNNLFNQKYQINKGYPMPGVTLFAGVNLKLE